MNLRERRQSGGLESEAHWVAECILSGVPDLAIKALAADAEDTGGVIRQARCQVIGDRGLRPDLRALAIKRTKAQRDRDVLLALCAVVDGANAQAA